MIAIPAVDVRDGACVQLVGGDYADERVRLADPAAVARRFRALGFRSLHAVDLDAATGRGANDVVMTGVLAAFDGEVQVGGGVRDDETAAAWIARGAARVVAGTRGVLDAAWLEALARREPGRVVLAADVRGREVVARGWTSGAGFDLEELLERVADLPLAAVLVTAVHREGRLAGPDLDVVRAARARTRHFLTAAGGIATPADLYALADAGADAAVIGMAFYTETLDPARVAEEFPS